MTEEDVAKNYLLNKVCESCLHFDIEFNGILFCMYEGRRYIPNEKTCENWIHDPFENPVEKLVRLRRRGRKFDCD